MDSSLHDGTCSKKNVFKREMKILVISQYYYPENFRINDICEELVRRDYDVTVLAGIPNYPKGEIFEGYEKSYKNIEVRNGVKIIRVNNRPRKTGTINLVFNYLSYVRLAKRKLRNLDSDFDLVYVYQLSPVTMISVGAKYAKKHKVPLYTYVCDVWPDSILDDKISRHNPVYLILKHISKKLYNKSDMIGVKCNEFTDYLVDVCKVDRNICHLNYEHAESNYLQVSEMPEDNGIIDFLFCGNFGSSSNCQQIIKAAAQLTGDFVVHFVGDGSDYKNMVSLTNELKLNDKIIFHGRVPQSETMKFYDIADVCLLTLTCNSVVGLTPPAKLTGYMAASRCIVASVNGAAKTIIEDSNCGFVCPADDVDKLAQLMQKVIDDPKRINELGQNGRRYFKEYFTLEKHVKLLDEHFLSIMKGGD